MRTLFILVLTQTLSIIGSGISGLAVGIRVYADTGNATPLLWLAGERDAVCGKASARRSAAFYKARFVPVKKAGHNLMMEHNYRQTAETIRGWLLDQGIE